MNQIQSAENAGASTQGFCFDPCIFFPPIAFVFRNNQFWFAKILLHYFFPKPLVLQVQVLPLFFLYDLCFQEFLKTLFSFIGIKPLRFYCLFYYSKCLQHLVFIEFWLSGVKPKLNIIKNLAYKIKFQARKCHYIFSNCNVHSCCVIAQKPKPKYKIYFVFVWVLLGKSLGKFRFCLAKLGIYFVLFFRKMCYSKSIKRSKK